MKYPILFGAVLVALLSACSKDEPAAPATPAPAPAAPRFDIASIAHGHELFVQNCAECHGPEAQGHPDWQTPSDGQFAAAPPLDGTGNDWKKSRAELAAVILGGVRRPGDKLDVMPAWKGRMSEQDIEDVLNFLQSLWSPEVYEAWRKAHPDTAASR
jgi:mono/diheme cytochrome c family protein